MRRLFVDGEALSHGPIDDGIIVEFDLDEAGDVQVPLVAYFDGYEVWGHVVGEPCRTTNRRGGWLTLVYLWTTYTPPRLLIRRS